MLVAFAPWVDGVGVVERGTGWPLHVLQPVAWGALAMWLAALINLPATFVFYTVLAVTTVVVAVEFTDCRDTGVEPLPLPAGVPASDIRRPVAPRPPSRLTPDRSRGRRPVPDDAPGSPRSSQ